MVHDKEIALDPDVTLTDESWHSFTIQLTDDVNDGDPVVESGTWFWLTSDYLDGSETVYGVFQVSPIL